jgi:hypothetical protein
MTARTRSVLANAVSAVAVAVLVASCGSTTDQPHTTPLPSLKPIALNGPAQGVARAIVTEAIHLREGPTPTGPELRDDLGHPLALDPGRLVVPLGDPQPGPGGAWVRAWVAPSRTVWPGDFDAWIPAKIGDRDTLRLLPSPDCPHVATIAALAPLLPQDRLHCVGSEPITFDARTWLPGVVPTYDVDPTWYGTNADPAGTTSLFDPGPVGFGQGAITTPAEAGAWIDARVPPGVPRLPVGVLLRVTGRFDDSSAAGCRRVLANGGAGIGLPDETAADSVTWCRQQFVVSTWQAVLGSEGRPFDPRDPQLHRREWVPPSGMTFTCWGVGLPPLMIRIDPTQVEPVWIETAGGHRSVAAFGLAFGLRSDPLRVQATNGAALVDGELVDPDRGKPGIQVCPEGDTVWFDVPTS